ncbi:threonylcarbamoyl-AMP synthase [Eggerthellaceae bacterium zg-893]|nr:threonylcarbamoyl-AMP synthase [Eggerthellaceae bacterium zg-893]
MENQANARFLEEAVEYLRKGQVVGVPTDTVYGLAIAPLAAGTPDALYAVKERDRGKPIAWLVGAASDLGRFGQNAPRYADALAEAFWPGSLTLVVEASPRVPRPFQSAAGTIGLRMPDHPVALDVLQRLGQPIAATSANRSGAPAADVLAALDPAIREQVAFALPDDSDADAPSGTASTVVDCTGPAPRILREGGTSEADIRAVVRAFARPI